VRKIERRLSKSHLDAVEPVCRREGESMLHEEVILHLDNTVVVSLGIDDHFFHDLRIDVPFYFCCFVILGLRRIQCFFLFSGSFTSIRMTDTTESLELIEFSTFYNLESLGYIHLDWLISPEVSCSFDLFLREGVIYEISKCIIKIKWTHTSREEFTESSISFHTREYLFCEDLPLFLGILLVEDTIRLILQLDTAEAE
jgi:hypothetical protein